MPIEIVPPRLFASRLPTGQREVFCWLRLPPDEPPAAGDRVAWEIGDAVRGTLRVTEEHRAAGRIALAALLPPAWAGGTLTVRAEGGEAVSREVACYAQPMAFRLPLHGIVLVLGGHRVGEVHRSAWPFLAQGFAWDFLPMARNLRLMNRSYNAETRPADFYGFGRNVLAPATGLVVQTWEGREDLPQIGVLPDRAAFLEDVTRALGNAVVIDHGRGVWSVLAHLMQGSLRVRLGDPIGVGQRIGQLGNSGFTSGPHVHLHFMDGPDVRTASPLPVELDVDGERRAPQAGEMLGE